MGVKYDLSGISDMLCQLTKLINLEEIAHRNVMVDDMLELRDVSYHLPFKV